MNMKCSMQIEETFLKNIHKMLFIGAGHGDTVVKVLCYKSEGSWFDPSWCYWKFSLT